MDKEDCTEALLSTLRNPQWKQSNSVTDWDLSNVLWRAGILLTPEQLSALLADMKRRGLITGRERRGDSRVASLWGVRLTPSGEEWLAQRIQGGTVSARRALLSPAPAPQDPQEALSEEDETPERDRVQEAGSL